MKEIWKDVEEYKGMYQVSNLGNVKSLSREINRINSRPYVIKDKILSPCVNSKGYLVVSFCRKGSCISFSIHQLVAMCFLNHKPCGYKMIVDHINENPLNNRVDNLQLITQRENISKSSRTKKRYSKYTGVYNNANGIGYKSSICVKGKHIHLGVFNNEVEASMYYENAVLSLKNGVKIIKKSKGN